MPLSKPGVHHALSVSCRHHARARARAHAPSSPGLPAIGAEGFGDLSHWNLLGKMVPCGSLLHWGRVAHSSNALGGALDLNTHHLLTQPSRLSTRIAFVGSTRDPMLAPWPAWGTQDTGNPVLHLLSSLELAAHTAPSWPLPGYLSDSAKPTPLDVLSVPWAAGHRHWSLIIQFLLLMECPAVDHGCCMLHS